MWLVLVYPSKIHKITVRLTDGVLLFYGKLFITKIIQLIPQKEEEKNEFCGFHQNNNGKREKGQQHQQQLNKKTINNLFIYLKNTW